ncbi:nickel/cobalt transporter [Budviciaceae bacterium CWB-B4]|uniref:Nickel/cobalt efflux system n=1 Tax=Limnobaculum xujianqingii TaxID=2738837 RepID=A0A9D7AKV9_9GAMM|nr:nickel/cobalt transporter [Limnobaculum xujianqingii]MBK5074569.1 nickel/cobalt transporter [Limnobaculum xujianqingii]MBK5177765.1 nickel/cobalt transporter [Limnobaculum xujianqingii]
MPLIDNKPNYFSGRFWPLYLCLIALVLLAVLVWLKWPDFLLQSAIWQKQLHQQLVSLLQQVKQHPLETGGMLMLFSFIYGVLHSAGPGHGKVIITAYLATHPLKLRASLLLTLAASLVQGVVAILLVTIVLSVLQLSTRTIHQTNFWMEKGSYLLIVLVGGILCYRAIRQLRSMVKQKPVPQTLKINALTPLEPGHVHSDSCGCGHRHLPTADELEVSGGWKTNLAIILSIGIRPCSGAILVLLFSKVIDAYPWGIAAAMVMALGTATTISLLALFVHYARRLAEKVTATRQRSEWGKVALISFSLFGGVLLILFGLVLYYGVSPAASGGLRYFG